jgi:hypothetical protein
MSVSLHNTISFYSRAWKIDSTDVIPLDIFLENIRHGEWQDIVNKVRTTQDKKERDELKKKIAPSVTISGKFTPERKDANLEAHSGYIGMDLDEGQLNGQSPEEVKEVLARDPYVAAAFVSIGGRGLCVLHRINPEKHREAFQGLCEYYFTQFKIICDPTSINPSRARFVSFDPHIYIADRVEKFTRYPKSKPPKKVDKVIYAKDDFTSVLNQIVEKRLNLCEDYHDWLRIGFSIASKFGEQGREYFHIVSQYSAKYDPETCNKQYDAIVKREGAGHGNNVNISTFYYYAKQAGLQIYTERTRKIAYSSTHGKKGGLNEEQVKNNLEQFEDITGEDVLEIIKQVYQSDIELNEDSLIEQLEIFIRQNYSLQRNEITRYIENNGEILKQKDFNTIFIKAKKIMERLSYEIVDRLINSDFVSTYNPFQRFFSEHGLNAFEQGIPDVLGNMGKDPTKGFDAKFGAPPRVRELFSTISTPDPDYLLHFGTKWMVGVISAIHGEHSPLMLVLSGDKQNTGKTEWFRRLLPKEWMLYYAESKLDAGKDDEILMCQKLLIMDDEMGGKSKKEVKRLKELTSKQTFSLREPYGRNNVDLNRLAVLAGTTNDNEILSDPTGNRRIIPIHVDSIDQELYNSIDKTALWLDVYELWKSGYRWKLNREDIMYLSKHSDEFEMSIGETELIQRYYEPGETEWVTATDIKVFIEKHTNQRLNLTRIGQDLKRLGFQQKHVKEKGTTRRIYGVNCLVQLSKVSVNQFTAPERDNDDLPF